MPEHPICHVEIPASDPAALSAFYAAVFDWHMQADPASNNHLFQPRRGPGGAFVKADDTARAQIGQVLIYISTDDINATLAQAEAQGAKTLPPKKEVSYGWFAIFADPSIEGRCEQRRASRRRSDHHV